MKTNPITTLAQYGTGIILAEAAGIIGSAFTFTAIPSWYATLEKPPLTPPNWIFGPVWTTLYALMGIAAVMVWRSRRSAQRTLALKLFTAQLIVNTLWSIVFFGAQSPKAGLAVIAGLLALIVTTMVTFNKVSRPAAALLIPYLLWVSFATYLTAGIATLNP